MNQSITRNFLGTYKNYCFIVALLWLFHCLSYFYQLPLTGVLPRSVDGFWGVLTAPLVHDSFYHLLSNTGGLLIFGALFCLFCPGSFWKALGVIYLSHGFLVWVFARKAYHLGASGVLFGLLGYLLLRGLFTRRPSLLFLSSIMVVLYGGMVWQIFPINASVSWEAHLFGFITGALWAKYERNL